MSEKPLYHWIPKWVLLLIDDKKCSRCDVKQQKEGISSIGVRKVKDEWCFVIEHVCSKCEFREILGFNEGSDLEDFCHMMLQEIMEKKSMDKARARQRGRLYEAITDKEVNDFLKFMHGSEDYDSVLKHIGYNESPVERETRAEAEKKRRKSKRKSKQKSKPRKSPKTKPTSDASDASDANGARKTARKRKEDNNESP